MKDLEQRVKELEAMILELYKRIWKLEGNSFRSAPDEDWLKSLKRDAKIRD